MRNMGHTRIPRLVTPIVAMLAGNVAHFQTAKAPLEHLLGPVELESDLYPFDGTDYYKDTMGLSIQRKFYSFQKLADPSLIADWKLAANTIEANLRQVIHAAAAPGAVKVERPINLDPGYITGAKLVLATTKDFAHRLYLRDGIFAEITMGFRGDSWYSHMYTFPDYKSGAYDAFFSRVRDRHLRKIKQFRRSQGIK
jgi:hypothetical protein